MKDLMMLYGVTLGKRYSKMQKALFYGQISESFGKLGFAVRVQQRKSWLQSVTNIIAGDLSRANVIFAAAYDTPTKAMLPGYRYFPFHTARNVRSEQLNMAAHILLAALLSAAAYYCGYGFLTQAGGLRAALLALTVAIALLALVSIRPVPNRFNFNRNSASIAAMAAVAENLRGSSGAAFVFLDQTVASFEGLKLLQQEDGVAGKTIVMLDSIAAGEKLLVAHQAAEDAQAALLAGIMKDAGVELSERAYSDEKAKNNVLYFGKRMLYMVSGTVEKKDFVVRKTRSGGDVGLNLSRLEGIAKALTAFAGEAQK